MKQKQLNPDKKLLAYIIGLALGDGNLSNPNGRAVRLRITCDKKYPFLIKEIQKSIRTLLPENKVSIVHRKGNCLDISCFSNYWESLLGWKAKEGSKIKQTVSVPFWIKKNRNHSIQCLKGLIETDGSIYSDRGYKMVNFVTYIPNLANDVIKMIENIGFNPNVQKLKISNNIKYTIRISRNAEKFIKTVKINKS
ncbi:MAG: LAGLIDADG family homing endonuclease [Patescibacteria group bacterium]